MDIYNQILKLEEVALDFQQKNKFNKTLEHHSEAIRLCKKLERPRLLAVLLFRLGKTYELDNNPATAVLAYEHGLKALQEDSKLKLDNILIEKRRARKGYNDPEVDFFLPDMFQAATEINISAAVSDPALHLKLLMNSGKTYLQRYQLNAANQDFQLMLARPEVADFPLIKAKALSFSGLTHYLQNEPDKALEEIEKALTLCTAHGKQTETRQALAVKAHIYQDNGKIEQALAYYEQAILLYESASDKRGKGQVLARLCDLYVKEKKYSKAESGYLEVIEIAKKQKDRVTLQHAYTKLGFCQKLMGKTSEAIQVLQKSIPLILSYQKRLRTDEGKVSFLDSVEEVFDVLIVLLLKENKLTEALEISEKARGQSLLALMNGYKRRRIQRKHTKSGDLPSNFDDLSESASSTPSFLGPQMNVQMAVGIPTPLDLSSLGFPDMETQMELPSPAPLSRLVFHILENKTIVFAINLESQVFVHQSDWSEKILTEKVKLLRQLLKVDDTPRGVRGIRTRKRYKDSEKNSSGLLREMYNELIKPLDQYFPKNETPLILEPQGPLWLLPFAALQDEKGSWMGDKWSLLYAPSADVTEEIRKEKEYGTPKTLNALFVGNPEMPEKIPGISTSLHFDPLPGAEKEVKALSKFFPAEQCNLLLGKEATRTKILEEISKYNIVHLATHGLANADDPLNSFLILSPDEKDNAVLTARDVIRLDIPSDLVVLSACQTGLGRITGDGMIGLSRSFLVSGARSILVSQWSVSDEATEALMTSFYKYYLREDDKATAMQKAMKEIREIPSFQHPRFWAPFIVVGAEK